MPVSRDEALNEITRLAAVLQDLRRKGQEHFVLYIGTRAAVTRDGRSFGEELRRQVLLAEWGAHLSEAEWERLSENEKEEIFNRYWRQLPMRNQRVRDICSALPLTDGYRALARLLKEGYFRVILTSNVDRLIEDALVREDVGRNQWCGLADGRDSHEAVRAELAAVRARSVIVQLCGDAYSQRFSVTLHDAEQYTKPLISALADYLSRPLIIVGYDLLDDRIIQHFPPRDEVVYYAGTALPPGDWFFYQRFPSQNRIDIVDGSITFDFFFTFLAQRLGLFQELERVGRPVTEEVVQQVLEKGPRAGAEELLVEIISTERRKKPQPPETEGLVSLVQTTVFTIRVDAGRQVSFGVTGDINYISEIAEEWRVNVDDLNILLQDMGRDIAAYHRLGDQEGRDSWRRRAKREGQRLYEDLMAASSDLSRKLELARQAVEPPENLTLVFSGPRHHLGMPYELLHDGKVPLAVRHPLCRQVSGVTVRHTQNLDAFVRALRRKNEPLRMLLIASDTGGLAVDEEVEVIRQKARQAQLNLKIDCLLTDEASLGEVEKRLRQCSYHLVHYAGHGHFDQATGENSGLLFWKDRNRRGGTALLTARQLAQLLAGGQTMLFYLSTCVGAQVGSEQLLRDNDYLGVMDAVVQAGVPYVLGYRWYVTDSGSRRFASHFYERLFTSPYVPEQAVLYARSQVYGADGTDETWISPILVAQNLYR
jgi:CHAT domain-containing protein